MSTERRFRTRATVVRAGDTTTLVSVEGWFGGQVLAPVQTWIIEATVGKPWEQLRDTRLWVMARLTAQSADELDLQQWAVYPEFRAAGSSLAAVPACGETFGARVWSRG